MIRIFVDHPLKEAQTIEMEKSQAHYLLTVMRLPHGALVRVFNGVEGEWEAQLQQTSKKACTLNVTRLFTAQRNEPEKHLLFPPIRQNRLDFMIEKGTELGVTHFHPVRTAHTVVKAINTDRLRKIAIEAAEQCERLTIPTFSPLIPLRESLVHWNSPMNLYVGAERQEAQTPFNTVSLPCGFLVGPEGGFSAEEFSLFESYDFIHPVSLGGPILRTETAALVMAAKAMGTA